MKSIIEIEGKKVGIGQPCFIIGEIGSNHCLDKKVVKGLIDASSDAGFDAVKFQIYDAKEAFITSTTKHILPVVEIDSKVVGDGVPGEVTKKLMALYQKFVQSQVG